MTNIETGYTSFTGTDRERIHASLSGTDRDRNHIPFPGNDKFTNTNPFLTNVYMDRGHAYMYVFYMYSLSHIKCRN